MSGIQITKVWTDEDRVLIRFWLDEIRDKGKNLTGFEKLFIGKMQPQTEWTEKQVDLIRQIYGDRT